MTLRFHNIETLHVSDMDFGCNIYPRRQRMMAFVEREKKGDWVNLNGRGFVEHLRTRYEMNSTLWANEWVSFEFLDFPWMRKIYSGCVWIRKNGNKNSIVPKLKYVATSCVIRISKILEFIAWAAAADAAAVVVAVHNGYERIFPILLH